MKCNNSSSEPVLCFQYILLYLSILYNVLTFFCPIDKIFSPEKYMYITPITVYQIYQIWFLRKKLTLIFVFECNTSVCQILPWLFSNFYYIWFTFASVLNVLSYFFVSLQTVYLIYLLRKVHVLAALPWAILQAAPVLKGTGKEKPL